MAEDGAHDGERASPTEQPAPFPCTNTSSAPVAARPPSAADANGAAAAEPAAATEPAAPAAAGAAWSPHGQRVVLVTGAASGIGRAACVRFARDGCVIVCCDLTEAAAAATLALCDNHGLALRCDVRDEHDVEHAVRVATNHYGRLDVAFNNAGVEGARAATADATEANWECADLRLEPCSRRSRPPHTRLFTCSPALRVPAYGCPVGPVPVDAGAGADDGVGADVGAGAE